MYEIASQCNTILASNKSAAASNLDDSYNQLGIKKSSGAATLSRSDVRIMLNYFVCI